MSKPFRYALATFCFAVSVVCLACWGWLVLSGSSITIYVDVVASKSYCIELQRNSIAWQSFPGRPLFPPIALEVEREPYFWNLPVLIKRHGAFGVVGPLTFFPIWYLVPIFALAGVGVLRVRRQFSILSAMIATAIVAALIGMVIVL